MVYYDISPTINSKLAVFPGDTPFTRTIEQDYAKGDHMCLSSINTTVHIGAHVDAPCHYQQDGESIDKRNLNYYYGPCQVISIPFKEKAGRIYPQDIKDVPIKAERVLFHTHSFPDPYQWSDDFMGLSPELITYLAEKKVILVGIDTPSMDPAHSKLLETHQEIFKHNMAILEGIVLTEVKDGLYTLIALPLKIENGDASPVRAVLLP